MRLFFFNSSSPGAVISAADSGLLIVILVVLVWLWSPMIHWGERRWRSAKGESYLDPMQRLGSLSRMYKKLCMRVEWGAAHCSKVSDELSMDYNSVTITALIFLILRFLSLAVRLLKFGVKPLKQKISQSPLSVQTVPYFSSRLCSNLKYAKKVFVFFQYICMQISKLISLWI